MFNNMVHTMFIFHDRDDKFLNFNTQKENQIEDDSMLKAPEDDVFYNNRFYGHNEWIEISEPVRIIFNLEKSKSRSSSL